MPHQRITKEMVVQAAFDLAREGGMEQVQVKALAKKLGCSVQPIYSYCNNMPELKHEVVVRTADYLRQYMAEHIDETNLFRSVGIAHAQFAREEPYLYRLYFLRERKKIRSLEDVYTTETDPRIAATIARERQIPLEQARALHRHLMIYNIGLSFILSALGAKTDINQIAQLLDQANDAFSGWISRQQQEDSL